MTVRLDCKNVLLRLECANKFIHLFCFLGLKLVKRHVRASKAPERQTNQSNILRKCLVPCTQSDLILDDCVYIFYGLTVCYGCIVGRFCLRVCDIEYSSSSSSSSRRHKSSNDDEKRANMSTFHFGWLLVCIVCAQQYCSVENKDETIGLTKINCLSDENGGVFFRVVFRSVFFVRNNNRKC